MKRFQLFAYSQYYPYGGSNDIVGQADTLTALKIVFTTTKKESYEILDLKERRWLTSREVYAARSLK